MDASPGRHDAQVSVLLVKMFRWNPVRGAGFNALGIAAGGGACRALALWVHDPAMSKVKA